MEVAEAAVMAALLPPTNTLLLTTLLPKLEPLIVILEPDAPAGGEMEVMVTGAKTVTIAAVENAEVLLFTSVAVAVMRSLKVKEPGNDQDPLAAVTVPRYVLPWSPPPACGVSLKISIASVAPVVVPEIVDVLAERIVGAVLLLLAPAPANEIPVTVLAYILFPEILLLTLPAKTLTP